MHPTITADELKFIEISKKETDYVLEKDFVKLKCFKNRENKRLLISNVFILFRMKKFHGKLFLLQDLFGLLTLRNSLVLG